MKIYLYMFYSKQNFYKIISLVSILFSLTVLKSFGQNCVISTVNPSFESPNIGTPETDVCDSANPNCGLPMSMTGWVTTEADHQIEVWRGTTNSGIATTSVGSPGNFAAADGNQFIELNANDVGALYQDFSTPYPTTFTVKFSHRGRGGQLGVGAGGTYDTARVYAGSSAVGNTLAHIITLTPLITVTDNNASWGTYTTTYTVPLGQTTTRFAFAAVATASGSSAAGNFLDNIQFTANNSINGTGQIALSCTLDQATITAGGLSGTWSQDPTNPTTTTINLTPSDINNTTLIGGGWCYWNL